MFIGVRTVIRLDHSPYPTRDDTSVARKRSASESTVRFDYPNFITVPDPIMVRACTSYRTGTEYVTRGVGTAQSMVRLRLSEVPYRNAAQLVLRTLHSNIRSRYAVPCCMLRVQK